MPIREQSEDSPHRHALFSLLERMLDLAAKALPADRTKGAVPQCISECRSGSAIQAEAEPRRESGGPKGPRGVIMKAARMQDAKSPCRQIFEATQSYRSAFAIAAGLNALAALLATRLPPTGLLLSEWPGPDRAAPAQRPASCSSKFREICHPQS